MKLNTPFFANMISLSLSMSLAELSRAHILSPSKIKHLFSLVTPYLHLLINSPFHVYYSDENRKIESSEKKCLALL